MRDALRDSAFDRLKYGWWRYLMKMRAAMPQVPRRPVAVIRQRFMPNVGVVDRGESIFPLPLPSGH